ncbi:MAG: LEM-3-like GIY-YIG domain-containing protein [Thermodesulfobacteriota bacterium]
MFDFAENVQNYIDSVTIDSAVSEELGYYVYMLSDPRSGLPFYIGVGVGSRVLSHFEESLKKEGSTSSKLNIISEIFKYGMLPIVHIVRRGLTRKEALIVESSLIDVLRCLPNASISNIQSGHCSKECGIVSLDVLVSEYAAEEAQIDFPAVIIKINRQWKRTMTIEQVYEATRKYWAVNVDRARGAERVLSVANGLIRAVFKDVKWMDARMSPGVPGAVAKRKEFEGTDDSSGKYKHLLGKHVRHISGRSQYPVLYVNC